MSAGSPRRSIHRPISVVVNTVDRAASLALTLEALERLDYPQFEVVVVNGPSTDHTGEVLDRWRGRIKLGHCPDRNLSESRNIGIALASGEVVAFIDDDAYPDPAWLDRLNEAYEDPEVGGAGGPVYSHTGYDIQAWVNFADRLGHVWDNKQRDVDRDALLAFPLSREFITLIGTNSSFRRDALLDVGGFDEDFVYFLDETELCCRLIDRGYVLRHVDDGFVYHKFLPNDIRKDNRVFRDGFQILKSRFYMALKHGARTNSFLEVCESIVHAVDTLRGHFEEYVESGDLTEDDRQKFERDCHLAADAAMKCFLRPAPLTRSEAWFGALRRPFLPFETLRPPERKLHVCFFSSEYPPGPVNGIGRQTHSLATGLAASGHLVRVLTRSDSHDRVDLEGGVWVHRMVPRPHARPASPAVPEHIWDYSATLHDELLRIHSHRAVDVVQVPNWDSEGLATVIDGRVPTVVPLYTPLKSVAATDPRFGDALRSGDPELSALVECERYVYEHADGVVACGLSIVAEIERQYGVHFAADRIGIVPHGLTDDAADVAPRPGGGPVEVLFVGRLEPRKGIDVLLDALPGLAGRFPDAVFTIAGDDSVEGPSGATYRRAFEESHPELFGRVVFTGRVADTELRELYARCDVFVAPSRFESFGLVLIEAMMFSKPVVTTTGCMLGIVDDGVNGLVVDPGDAGALSGALARLVGSEQLRAEMGHRSREIYEERYTVDVMVATANEFFDVFTGRVTAGAGRLSPGRPVPGPRPAAQA